MRKRFTIAFIAICLFTTTGFSQGSAVGTWRTHLPYSKVIDIAIFNDVVYAATDISMFTYNTNDNSVTRLDKVKGLNDIGISSIGINESTNQLLVAYTNTNIDIINEDGVIINIPDIKDKEILGNKTINGITFMNELAYLSCGFGIVVVDMERYEIKDTYYIGADGSAVNVLSTAYNDTSIFASSDEGIYFADINATNLADFHQWSKDQTLMYPNFKYNYIVNFGGNLITNYYSGSYSTDTMFIKSGDNWDYFDKENTLQHRQIKVVDDKLLVVNQYSVYVYDSNLERIQNIYYPSEQYLNPLSANIDDEFVWIGDNSKGLVKTWGNGWVGELIKPNGPSKSSIFDMDAGGNNVWVAAGGRQSDWSKLYMTDGVYSFVDDSWTTYNTWNTEAFNSITDFICVKVDPANDNIVYVGIWQAGLAKFNNNEVEEIYNADNSTLQPWISAEDLTLVSGIDFDSNHNLWVANSGATDLLSVMKNNGEWKSFNIGGSLSGGDISKMIIDKLDQKWIIKRSSGLMIVFTDNGTIDDISDDETKVLYSTTGQGNIPGSKVYASAVDQDGEIWLGTDEGIGVFYSPGNIFTSGANYDAQKILVPRDDGSGLADYLLETELVTAIAVDGDNRKWVGTERAGLFLFSDDGLEEILHFTEENSPLLSNNIMSISINDDGEVFVGTASGIISYKSTATPPNPSGTKVYAYPNPVRENYTGDITIKGLEEDTYVRITDNYGNLVYSTQSVGGSVSIKYAAESVGDVAWPDVFKATGVYMVFAMNIDKTEKVVTKILIVR